MNKKVVEVGGHCPNPSKIIKIFIPSLDSHSSIVCFFVVVLLFCESDYFLIFCPPLFEWIIGPAVFVMTLKKKHKKETQGV